MTRHGFVRRAALLAQAVWILRPSLTVFRHKRIPLQLAVVGKVQIAKIICIQQFTQNNDLTEIHDIDCWIDMSA